MITETRELPMAVESRDDYLNVDRSRSEEHTSELQSPCNLVCRLLLEKKNTIRYTVCASGRIRAITSTWGLDRDLRRRPAHTGGSPSAPLRVMALAAHPTKRPHPERL